MAIRSLAAPSRCKPQPIGARRAPWGFSATHCRPKESQSPEPRSLNSVSTDKLWQSRVLSIPIIAAEASSAPRAAKSHTRNVEAGLAHITIRRQSQPISETESTKSSYSYSYSYRVTLFNELFSEEQLVTRVFIAQRIYYVKYTLIVLFTKLYRRKSGIFDVCWFLLFAAWCYYLVMIPNPSQWFRPLARYDWPLH